MHLFVKVSIAYKIGGMRGSWKSRIDDRLAYQLQELRESFRAELRQSEPSAWISLELICATGPIRGDRKDILPELEGRVASAMDYPIALTR
jgi:hypothetical protein